MSCRPPSCASIAAMRVRISSTEELAVSAVTRLSAIATDSAETSAESTVAASEYCAASPVFFSCASARADSSACSFSAACSLCSAVVRHSAMRSSKCCSVSFSDSLSAFRRSIASVLCKTEFSSTRACASSADACSSKCAAALRISSICTLISRVFSAALSIFSPIISNSSAAALCPASAVAILCSCSRRRSLVRSIV